MFGRGAARTSAARPSAADEQAAEHREGDEQGKASGRVTRSVFISSPPSSSAGGDAAGPPEGPGELPAPIFPGGEQLPGLVRIVGAAVVGLADVLGEVVQAERAQRRLRAAVRPCPGGVERCCRSGRASSRPGEPRPGRRAASRACRAAPCSSRPVRCGSRLTPSSPHSGFAATPAAASAVGRTSSWITGWS